MTAAGQALLDVLLPLELALARRDPAGTGRDLADLLDDGAMEFGSSGRRWDRQAIVGLLDARLDDAGIDAEAAEAAELAPGVALLTYTIVIRPADGPPRRSLRSSIWLRRDGRWRLRFHQGTPVPVGR